MININIYDYYHLNVLSDDLIVWDWSCLSKSVTKPSRLRGYRECADVEGAGHRRRGIELAHRRGPERTRRSADRLLGRRVRQNGADRGMEKRPPGQPAGIRLPEQPRYRQISRRAKQGAYRGVNRPWAREVIDRALERAARRIACSSGVAGESLLKRRADAALGFSVEAARRQGELVDQVGARTAFPA